MKMRCELERNQLASVNIGLAGAVCKRLWRVPAVRRFGFDQAFSEASLALLRAAEHWDEHRGIPFQAYACSAMTLAVLYAARRWAAKSPALSIDDIGESSHPPTPAQDAAIEPDEVAAVNKAVQELPLQCSLVLQLLLEGEDMHDVARLNGITHQAVSLFRQRGIGLLQEVLQVDVSGS
jgi:DNA-directed RNA polymerase specialized sigma24 family protein